MEKMCYNTQAEKYHTPTSQPLVLFIHDFFTNVTSSIVIKPPKKSVASKLHISILFLF